MALSSRTTAARADVGLMLGMLVLIGGIGFIYVSTLRPSTFVFRSLTLSEYLSSFGLAPSSVLDIPRNVILFLPMGFGLASLLDRHGMSLRSMLFVTSIAGLIVTVTVESLQIFQPDRTPNFFDLAANTLGAAVGVGCLALWQFRDKLVFAIGRKLIPRNVIVAYVAYLSLMFLLVWALMLGFRPGGWDAGYRLALGNELTSDRPWQGSVGDLLILDRAVDPSVTEQLMGGHIPTELRSSVVADYSFRKANGLSERTAILPDLVSRGEEDPQPGPGGIDLNGETWLATSSPVAELAGRVNRSGQFTIALTVATFDKSQTGPARIVTISRDPNHRNVTVGQEGEHLTFRWRSPLTGENGMTPELEFPDVFTSHEPVRAVLTFDGITARLFRAGEVRLIECFLGPEAGLGSVFNEGRHWPITPGRLPFFIYRIFISVLIFLPLGILLGTGFRLAEQGKARVILLMAGIFLPSLLLEGFIAWYRSGSPRPEMCFMALATTTTGVAGSLFFSRARGFDGGAR